MPTPAAPVKQEPQQDASGGGSHEDATTSGGPSGTGSKRPRGPSVEPPAAQRSVRARTAVVVPKEEHAGPQGGAQGGPVAEGGTVGPSLAGPSSAGGAGPSGVHVEEHEEEEEEEEEEGSGSDMGDEEDDEETLDQVCFCCW